MEGYLFSLGFELDWISRPCLPGGGGWVGDEKNKVREKERKIFWLGELGKREI